MSITILTQISSVVCGITNQRAGANHEQHWISSTAMERFLGPFETYGTSPQPFLKLAQSKMLIFVGKGTAGDASKLFNLILCLGHSVIKSPILQGIKLDAKIHGHFEGLPSY